MVLLLLLKAEKKMCLFLTHKNEVNQGFGFILLGPGKVRIASTF
jgi:hypothetical protein